MTSNFEKKSMSRLSYISKTFLMHCCYNIAQNLLIQKMVMGQGSAKFISFDILQIILSKKCLCVHYIFKCIIVIVFNAVLYKQTI